MNRREPELELTAADLRRVLLESLDLDVADAHLAGGEKIQDVIAMDSVAILRFVVALDARFGVSLEEDWLAIDRLTDLPALAAYIRQRAAASAASDGGAAEVQRGDDR